MSRYDDILHLPHPVSPRRARMPMIDRAAQFSPFAALSGFESVIEETGRITHRPAELDDSGKAALNAKLLAIAQEENPIVTVTYFQFDERKPGGAYISVTGPVKKVDAYERCIRMADMTVIPFSLIYEIEGDFLPAQT